MANKNRKSSKLPRNEEIVEETIETTVPTVDEVEENMTVAAAEAAIDASDDASDDAAESDASQDTLEASDEDDVSNDTSDGDSKVRKLRGKRQAFYDCAANVILTVDLTDRNLKIGDSALILDPTPVTMPGNEGEFDRASAKAEAINTFTAKWGVAPELINGPIYNMKGIVAAPRKRETINVTVAKEAPFTTERGKAIHRFKDVDWNVLVNFTERKDTVFVFYETLVDPKQPMRTPEKSKFQKPTPKFLPIAALRDLQKSASA